MNRTELKRGHYSCGQKNNFRPVRKIAKSDYYLRHVCLSVRRSALNNSAPTGRILTEFGISLFLENLSRKFKYH